MGNTFGHLFRITTWGESHGGGVGVVIDGCPPNLEISAEEIQVDLDRRRWFLVYDGQQLEPVRSAGRDQSHPDR